jgi:hypothetical protein
MEGYWYLQGKTAGPAFAIDFKVASWLKGLKFLSFEIEIDDSPFRGKKEVFRSISFKEQCHASSKPPAKFCPYHGPLCVDDPSETNLQSAGQ